MSRLVLYRHCKSDWRDDALADHERPLNERGYRTASQMADWFHATDRFPELILCSSALRTRETLAPIVEKKLVEVEILDELYLASEQVLTRVIAERGGSNQILMVIAHNPGLEKLVARLTGEHRAFPTGACAVLDYDAKCWSEVGFGSPKRSELFLPKSLFSLKGD